MKRVQLRELNPSDSAVRARLSASNAGIDRGDGAKDSKICTFKGNKLKGGANELIKKE